MATKKESWPKVEKGNHLTVTVYADGRRELKWDDDALLEEIRSATASVKIETPKKATKKVAKSKKSK